MNKKELIQAVAEGAEITQAEANKVINAFMSTVIATLGKGDSINLVGFGSFIVRDRAARKGKNPQTGEAIDIPAAKVPVFRPGKSLKEVVNVNEKKKAKKKSKKK